MAKKTKRIMYLIPEGETRDSHTHRYMAYKTHKMIIEHKKLRLRKFNPVKREYEYYVEAKLPSHK
jgi:large subunit ribosomal protein L33